MRHIPVYKRGAIVAYATVDACDYERLNAHRWGRDKDGYAVRNVRVDGKRRTIRMHREVLGLEHGDPLQCDHRNHKQKLNNTRANLRTCTHAENQRNRGRRKDNASGYRGVHWHKQGNKWRARARVSGRELSVGLYRDKLAAAYAVELFVSLVTPAEDFENPQWPEGPLQAHDLYEATARARRAAHKFRNV